MRKSLYVVDTKCNESSSKLEVTEAPSPLYRRVASARITTKIQVSVPQFTSRLE